MKVIHLAIGVLLAQVCLAAASVGTDQTVETEGRYTKSRAAPKVREIEVTAGDEQFENGRKGTKPPPKEDKTGSEEPEVCKQRKDMSWIEAKFQDMHVGQKRFTTKWQLNHVLREMQTNLASDYFRLYEVKLVHYSLSLQGEYARADTLLKQNPIMTPQGAIKHLPNMYEIEIEDNDKCQLSWNMSITIHDFNECSSDVEDDGDVS